ncbi:MAG: tetratricopeptide repeat protein [Candidatus Dadabacteria bacterium]|nr:tetratricopeptide repeat protein [Candidatus Dadabacteria bacterium]
MTTPQERFIREEEFLRLFKKARKELDDGNVKAAVSHLEKAYELSPDSEGVENLLGILYFRLKDYRKAEDIYLKLTKKNPGVFTLRTNLGLIYFKEKRYVDSIRELDKATKLKPDYARAHNYLGLVYVELGKYRQAREEFLRAGSRVMAKKMESIIAGSMNAETIQTSYRGKEKRPTEQQEPEVGQFILDPELRKILDDFEEVETNRSPAKDVQSNVEHIRLDLGKEGLMEASSLSDPIFTPPKARSLGRQEPYSAFTLGLTQKDTGYDAHNLLNVYFTVGTFSRVGGLIAAEGKHVFSPARRRIKGTFSDQQLGGSADPIMKIAGEGTLLLSAGEKRIVIVQVTPKENLYVTEDALFSFQSTISWENGTINFGPKEKIELVQLSGEGNVAILSKKAPSLHEVPEGKPARVARGRLVGWQGRLTPKIIAERHEEEPKTGEAYFIEFTGKGRIIVE